MIQGAVLGIMLQRGVGALNSQGMPPGGTGRRPLRPRGAASVSGRPALQAGPGHSGPDPKPAASKPPPIPGDDSGTAGWRAGARTSRVEAAPTPPSARRDSGDAATDRHRSASSLPLDPPPFAMGIGSQGIRQTARPATAPRSLGPPAPGAGPYSTVDRDALDAVEPYPSRSGRQ